MAGENREQGGRAPAAQQGSLRGEALARHHDGRKGFGPGRPAASRGRGEPRRPKAAPDQDDAGERFRAPRGDWGE